MKHLSITSSLKRSLGTSAGLLLILLLIIAVIGVQRSSATSGGSGSISLTTPGSAYTQDFDTLASSGSSNVLPNGWRLDETGTSAANDGNYTAGTGSGTAGDIYSFGAAASTERAFGTLRSGTLVPIIGASFTNNTGAVITQLDVSYTGEQWRLGTANRGSDRLDFQISTNATSLTTGTYTDVNNLDFSGPINTGTVGALNGNLAANRATITFTINGLSIPNGATFFIRWTDLDVSGADDGLAVDDFSLTPNTSSDPSGVGAANPSTVAPGGTTVLTVAVTPGTNPASTGIMVAGDLTAIGGSATQTFFDDGSNGGDVTPNDNTFTFQATVSLATTTGPKSLPISITDAQGRSASTTISLTVQSATVTPGSVVISQIFGGGGNSGAPLRQDFIELFNRTSNPINITGWTVQYTSAAGTSWQTTPLSGMIAPGKYFLVQESEGVNGGNIPPPDATGTIAMSATAGKVALVSDSTALTGACPTGASIIDFVGYGSANCFEGPAAAPGLSNTTAARRALNGCTDTDNNSADFASGAPAPRNSASPFNDCTAPPPPPFKAIHEIQGSGNASPFVGQILSTSGIVTGIKQGSGFFIQTPDIDADNDSNSSEGIFVFTGSSIPASAVIGNSVTVTGTVQEFIPSADPNSPPVTEIGGSPSVAVNSTGNSLPAAITLTAADTSPTGTIEQLERFEGMRVHVASLTVIAPTQGSISEQNANSNTNGTFYGVITGIARPFREPGIELPDPLPAGSPCCVPRFDANPERLRVDSDSQPGTTALNLTTGATVTNITGPFDYSFRTYTILPDAATPPVATGNISVVPVPVPGANEFTVASFNMQRFFDTTDDPGISDVALTATAFNNRLNKASLAIRNVMRAPDIIGIVEMENLATLQAVANKVNNDAVAAGQPNPNYQAFLEEGNDIGGIDVGFLVKAAPRVTVIDVTQEGKTTTYINPNNGQPELLNDRPSLVLRATIQGPSGPALPVTVIVNHLRSLSGVEDPSDGNRIRTKRRAQAEFLANLIQARQTANPNERIISVGDYNAFQFNDGYVDSIGTIKGTPTPADQVVLASGDLVNPDLTDLVDLISADQRYSFSFDGNAQELDHILITGNLLQLTNGLHYARSNTDFPETFRGDATRPERLSDHDMPVAYFAFPVTDLSITKAASSSSVETGSQFSYTVTVTNNGTVTAENVVVSDNLPAEVTFDSCASTGGGVCGGSGNNRTVTFSSIPGGGSAVITLTATLGCSVANGTTINNTASLSSTTPDNNLNNDSFTVGITASNPPPQITCPGNVVAGNAAGQCSAVVNYSAPAVTDNCAGTSVVCSPSSGSVFPKGTTAITCTATDSGGAASSCSFTVTVNDTEAPAITGQSASPSSLGPPNHKMVNVTVSYTTTDNCGPVTCALSVTSNEPVNGDDDGNTSPDWIVVNDHQVQLRAERSGSGTGRIYTITITCTDGSGNTSSKNVTVLVPLN